LHHRAVIEHRNAMIRNKKVCLQMRASARRALLPLDCKRV
jgi:hypothetical protein